MKHRIQVWGAKALIVSAAGIPAVAQVPSHKWDITVAPYFMGASTKGTTAVRGREVEVDVSAVNVDQNQTWVDPLVGLTLRSPKEHRVRLQVYTEMGGFGAGSDFTWQIFPTLGIKVADRVSLELGYRFLDLDYSTGAGNQRFGYDVLTQGSIGGLAFRF